MPTRRAVVVGLVWVAAGIAAAQPPLLADGLYLVLEDEDDGAVWLAFRGRDDGEFVARERLMAFAVQSAAAVFDDYFGAPVVAITLAGAARKQFGEISQAYMGARLALVLGGAIVTAPRIVEPIHGGEIQISTYGDLAEAEALAAALMASRPD